MHYLSNYVTKKLHEKVDLPEESLHVGVEFIDVAELERFEFLSDCLDADHWLRFIGVFLVT